MRLDEIYYLNNAEALAKDLVGKLICLRLESGEVMRMRITETECYLGEDDTACHASRGKTERNGALWLAGGHTYVYLCYGMYHMFNVITGKEGDPQGVLIRGIEGYMGPGRFTKHCGIDRSFDRLDLRSSDRIWIEEDGFFPDQICSPRIGIDYASAVDRERLWRFTDSRFFKK